MPSAPQETEGIFMAEAADYMRPPESEIYGRSLSTIRRLGAFMINKSLTEAIESPEASQARAEFYTSVEEGFGTDLELGGGLEVRDFDVRSVVGGRVLAKDLKTPVSVMTEAGLKCAKEKYSREMTNEDRRFLPQLIRSERDHENAVIVDEMARREANYNTRIVVSPFPEEAATQSGDAYWRKIGYVPHLRRGFVQLYHVTNEGSLLAGSLSFDGSNKQKIREVFAKHGISVPDDEITDNWLQYAITDTLSDNHAKVLATALADQLGDATYNKTTNTVDVTRKYQPIVDQVFNEAYVHICESLCRGYQTKEAAQLINQMTNNSQHFNERYRTALLGMSANTHQFSDDDSAVLHELLVYSTIEMMRAIHQQEKAESPEETQSYSDFMAWQLQTMDTEAFQNALGNFVAEGAKNNRGYSACGIEIFAGEGTDNPAGSPQSAFGGEGTGLNLFNSDSDQFGPRTFTCKHGHTNRRPLNKLINSCWFPGCKDSVGCGPKKKVSKEPGRKPDRKVQEVAMVKQVDEVLAKKEGMATETEDKSHRIQPVAQIALSGASV